jgi:DNA-binding transcriptional ArsR family regulator
MAIWHLNRFRDHHIAQGLLPAANLVAYSLASHIRNNDQYQIQVSRLAKESGLSESSVKRGLKALESAGIITSERVSRRRAAIYTWVMSCPAGCLNKYHYKDSKIVHTGEQWVPVAHKSGNAEWGQGDTTEQVTVTPLRNNKDGEEIETPKSIVISTNESKSIEAFTAEAIEQALEHIITTAETSLDHEVALHMIRDTYSREHMASEALNLWRDNPNDQRLESWAKYLYRCMENNPTSITDELDWDQASAVGMMISLWNNTGSGYRWHELSDGSRALCEHILESGHSLSADLVPFILRADSDDVEAWLDSLSPEVADEASDSEESPALADVYIEVPEELSEVHPEPAQLLPNKADVERQQNWDRIVSELAEPNRRYVELRGTRHLYDFALDVAVRANKRGLLIPEHLMKDHPGIVDVWIGNQRLVPAE